MFLFERNFNFSQHQAANSGFNEMGTSNVGVFRFKILKNLFPKKTALPRTAEKIKNGPKLFILRKVQKHLSRILVIRILISFRKDENFGIGYTGATNNA